MAAFLFRLVKGKSSSASSSTFYQQYIQLWQIDTDREDSEQESVSGPVNEEKVIMTRMRKRRLEAMESINDSMMETAAKKGIVIRYLSHI
jgi:hypothetical protein